MKTTMVVFLLAASSVWAQELDTAWVVHSIGPDSLADHPLCVAIDQAGDIVVAGVRRTASSQDDILTMMFASDGTILWSARYDGPAHRSDKPTHLVIDRYGYVYVAGTSRGISGSVENNDAVLLKYHPTGELVWVRRYEGQNSSQDAMNGLAVDPERNVLAAIRRIEYPTLTMNELVTLKLYPTGELAWTETLSVHRWSECYGITSDRQGNALLGGWLWQGSGNSDFEFFALVKYDENGSFLWFSPYRDSAAWSANSEVFAMDEEGNCFAAGQIEKISGEEVFATSKYDEDGNQLWHKEFLVEEVSDPEVIDIVTDREGNVFWLAMAYSDSTREDMILAKYFANGGSAWVRSFPLEGYQDPTAIAVDNEGSLYALCDTQIGGSVWGLLLVKLNGAGTVESTTLWEGDGKYYEPFDIAVDQDKNVIVIASVEFGPNSRSITTMMFRQSGATPVEASPSGTLPDGFALAQNYPNPFNPSTTISYRVPVRGFVTLTLYDVLGRLVGRLVDGVVEPGTHEVTWDASAMASGVYLYQLQWTGGSLLKTMILLH